jgi:hypothetical protein
MRAQPPAPHAEEAAIAAVSKYEVALAQPNTADDGPGPSSGPKREQPTYGYGRAFGGILEIVNRVSGR